ncbi:MAG: hypothetical protein IT348_14795 [Candidatus Eisenbacteria bacterium]|nr:hypothetical protein [Candidatus Eisenbacteria bacterium]
MLTAQFILSLALSAIMAWDPTGTWVSGRRVSIPQVAAGSTGDLFIAWEDRRSLSSRWSDCYFQALTPAGQLRPGWALGGMPACTTSADEAFEWMLPDGAGGVYIGWFVNKVLVDGGRDSYALRFGSDGLPHPSWPAAGVPYAANEWDESDAKVCSDGQHGIIVTWMSYQETGSSFDGGDCRVLRLLESGAVAPGWPDSGIAVGFGPGYHVLRKVVSDGLGGAYIVWNDTRNTGFFQVFVQRVTSFGAISPGWPVDGLRVCPVDSHQFLVDATSDDQHGLVLTWDDDRERPPGTDIMVPYGDIYAARIKPDGTHAEGWPLDGTPICVSPGVQWYPRMCPDGTGGALMAWADSRNRWGEIFMQRILGNGQVAPGWPVNGALVSSLPGEGLDPKPASDGAGGAYVAWHNDTYGYGYAHHMLGTGTAAPGWAPSGTRLVDITESLQDQMDICSDGAGNAITVWSDLRFNATGGIDGSIRAQKLVRDGLVPTQLAMRTVESSSDRVRLSWWGTGASQATFIVQRSEDGSDWSALGNATSLDADQLVYEDATVEPGQRYAYRLVNAAGQVVVTAEWVDVPAAARFALAGARPNPARASELSVAFSLAARGQGALELLDLAGRRAAWRDIGALAPGNHTARFHEASAFAPGIYWLRLSQGANHATARLVVIR